MIIKIKEQELISTYNLMIELFFELSNLSDEYGLSGRRMIKKYVKVVRKMQEEFYTKCLIETKKRKYEEYLVKTKKRKYEFRKQK